MRSLKTGVKYFYSPLSYFIFMIILVVVCIESLSSVTFVLIFRSVYGLHLLKFTDYLKIRVVYVWSNKGYRFSF